MSLVYLGTGMCVFGCFAFWAFILFFCVCFALLTFALLTFASSVCISSFSLDLGCVFGVFFCYRSCRHEYNLHSARRFGI